MSKQDISGNDGRDHINIYSKGETALGRFLSHFAKTPITIPKHGEFNSIEGYWYWLGTDHKDKDKLRDLSGYKAKELGRKYKAISEKKRSNFQTLIEEANRLKLEQYPKEMQEFKKSKLPFTHYYQYGDAKRDAGFHWVVEMWEKIRTEMQQENTEKLGQFLKDMRGQKKTENFFEITGDIFDSKCEVLVNTCNCVGAMGRGIALAMKNKYPIMYTAYRVQCFTKADDKLKPGDLWFWEAPNGTRICNMMVKDDWRKPATMAWIEKCLKELRRLIDNDKIKSVALPHIGANNGWLEWPPIYKMIKEILGNSKARVELYHFAEPKK